MLISGFLCIEAPPDETSLFYLISIVTTYIILFIFISIPVQMTFMLLEDFYILSAEELNDSYPILLEEVHTDRLSAVLFYPFFFFHQFSMVFIVMLLRGSLWL